MTPPVKREFFGKTGVTKVIETRLADPDSDAARIVERIMSENALTPDYRNLVRSYCVSSGGGECGQRLSEDLEALLAAIPGYRVAPGQLYRKYPWLLRPLGKLNRRNSGAWLRALLSLPQVLGYPGLVVLFDETETALTRGSVRQNQQHLAHIRTFVDHMAVGAFRGCAVYCAVVEEFMDIAWQQLEALAQRIERLPLNSTGMQCANSRAVWVDLDELTAPSPQQRQFFEELASRIVDLGREAGLPSEATERVLERLKPIAAEQAQSIYDGRVREFVKKAASCVADEVRAHES